MIKILLTILITLVILVVVFVGFSFYSNAQKQSEPIDKQVRTPGGISSQLYELYQAKQRGDLKEVAKSMNANLDDRDRILITILAKPKEASAAAEASKKLGGEVRGVVGDLVGVIMPVENLLLLSKDPSVRFIDRPILPVPLVPN